MSTAPVRRLVSSDCSLPSCSAPATRTARRPLLRSLISSPNLSAATQRGLPAAALWPSVMVT
jgi:hypothetical protein